MRRRGIVAVVAVACAAAALAAVALAAAPVAVTGSATSVTTAGAKLAGTVTPGGEATTYAFDYGTSTAYGSSTSTQSAGGGSAARAVEATLGGLRAGTTYHYRLVAANGSGTDAGADATFTTHAPPTVGTAAASAITGSSATISVAVNPRGRATRVVFDYGTSTAYGSSSAALDAGAGSASTTVRATIAGLRSGTTYHVRARATSDAGTTNGASRTFRTVTVSTPLATTGPATAVAPRSATLTGTATPRGAAAQAYYEYGTTTRYGRRTARVAIGAGAAAIAVRQAVGGLAPGTTYHYRIVATSSIGTARGGDRTLKTGVAPSLDPLEAEPPTVAYGGSAILTGRARGTGAGGSTVTLFTAPFPFSAFPPSGTGTADRDGVYHFPTGRLERTTRYFTRVTLFGERAQSRLLRVGVRPAVVFAVERIAGGRLRFEGTVRPSLPATVYLRKVGPRVTVTVRSTRARPAGAARRTFRITVPAPRARSVYRIRVRTDSRALTRYDSRPVAVAGRRR